MKWIIEGAESAIRKGFKIDEPQAVRDAVEKYREDNDWLGQFLEDHCDIDPSFTEKSGKLYQQYRVICMQSGEYIRSTSDFYGNLEKLDLPAGRQKRNPCLWLEAERRTGFLRLKCKGAGRCTSL